MVKVTGLEPEALEPVVFTVTVRLAQFEFPVWHKDTVPVPTAMPVILSWEPLIFKVIALGLEMLEI